MCVCALVLNGQWKVVNDALCRLGNTTALMIVQGFLLFFLNSWAQTAFWREMSSDLFTSITTQAAYVTVALHLVLPTGFSFSQRASVQSDVSLKPCTSAQKSSGESALTSQILTVLNKV